MSRRGAEPAESLKCRVFFSLRAPRLCETLLLFLFLLLAAVAGWARSGYIDGQMMNVRLVQILLLVSALVALPAGGAPVYPERDPLAPFRGSFSAREVLVEYFTASKNNDARTAASLIDYDEWAKARGLEGDEAKAWAKEHQAELAAGYAKDKAAGLVKEFRVVKETDDGERAVFEVEQERAGMTNLWQVTLVKKEGRWVVAGFRLLRITPRADAGAR
jgi:hypothetical protein